MKRIRKSRSKKALKNLTRENLKAIESSETMKQSKVTRTNTCDYAGSQRLHSAFEMFSDVSNFEDHIQIKPRCQHQATNDQIFKVEVRPAKTTVKTMVNTIVQKVSGHMTRSKFQKLSESEKKDVKFYKI